MVSTTDALALTLDRISMDTEYMGIDVMGVP